MFRPFSGHFPVISDIFRTFSDMFGHFPGVWEEQEFCSFLGHFGEMSGMFCTCLDMFRTFPGNVLHLGTFSGFLLGSFSTILNISGKFPGNVGEKIRKVQKSCWKSEKSKRKPKTFSSFFVDLCFLCIQPDITFDISITSF